MTPFLGGIEMEYIEKKCLEWREQIRDLVLKVDGSREDRVVVNGAESGNNSSNSTGNGWDDGWNTDNEWNVDPSKEYEISRVMDEVVTVLASVRKECLGIVMSSGGCVKTASDNKDGH